MAEVAAVKSLVAHFSAHMRSGPQFVFISPKSGRVGQSHLCSLVLVVGCKAQVGRWCPPARGLLEFHCTFRVGFVPSFSQGPFLFPPHTHSAI